MSSLGCVLWYPAADMCLSSNYASYSSLAAWPPACRSSNRLAHTCSVCQTRPASQILRGLITILWGRPSANAIGSRGQGAADVLLFNPRTAS
ncbi:Endochitinase A1 [Fusarium oxysporum f. sp. albedinis]|nr:Endochitinase A1 [Fusarium oxysporum f. sp. albedinis]